MDVHFKFWLKHKEFIRYLFVGNSAILWNWVCYSILIQCLPMVIANTLSWGITTLFAFLVNKIFVFGSRDFRKSTLIKEFISFVTTRGLTGFMEIVMQPQLFEFGLNQAWFGVEGLQAKIIVCLLLSIVNYISTKCFVFRTHTERAEFN